MPVVRELVALFGFKTDTKSVETVDQQIGEFFDKVKGLAAVAGAAAGLVMLKGVAESVGRLGNETLITARRLGIGAEALQELAYAADQADITREDLTIGLKSLSMAATDAANGGKETGKMFARLGVKARGADGEVRPIEDLLMGVASGLSRVGSATEKTAITQKLLGKSGMSMIPFLESERGLEAMRARAHELGVVMDKTLLDSANEWEDSTKDLNASLTGIKNVIGRALLPRLTALNKVWIRLLVGQRKLIHSTLERNMDRLGQVVENVADFFATLTEKITNFLASLTPLQKGLVAVSAIALALAGILMLPGGSLLVLIGLIGLVIDDFEVWRKGGISVIGDLLGSFDDFASAFGAGGKSISFVGSTMAKALNGLIAVFKVAGEIGGSLLALLFGLFTDPQVALKDFGQNVKTIFSDIVDAIGKSIGVDLPALFDLAMSVAKSFAKNALKSVFSVIDSVGESITGVIDSITSGFNIVAGVVKGFLSTFDKVIGSASIIGKIAQAAGAGFDFVAGGVSQAAGAYTTGRAAMGSSISQSNAVDINVNVSGGSNPEAVGQAVARPIENVMQRQFRNAMLGITSAAPVTGGSF